MLGCIINIFAFMNNDYAIAVQAALAAGKEILSIYQQQEFEIELKTDETPLTVADKRAHKMIVRALEETGIPILSEEGSHIPYSERANWSSFWLVDPLDGTKEFINRNGEFTVNIALIENGIAKFGVVLAPVLDTLYLGIPEAGAFRMECQGKDDQAFEHIPEFAVRLPLPDRNDTMLRVVASRSHYNQDTKDFIESLDTQGKEIELVNRGSSLKLCMVASGEADVYPRLGPTMEWDTAAAHAVVKAAGKNVYGIDTGTELAYNKKNLLNPYFVVK
jgi:3'(2'), 5'-bisphosphate nucleotidase